MKILKILFIAIALIGFEAYSQSQDYYFYHGSKKYLEIDRDYLNLNVTPNFQISTLNGAEYSIIDINILSCNPGESEGRIVQLKFQTSPSELIYYQKISELRNIVGVQNISYYYKRKPNQLPIGTSNSFYVKLKQASDVDILISLSNTKNVNITHSNKFMPLWYFISTKNNQVDNSVDLSNYFYETGYFDDIDPNFMFNFKNSTVIPPCVNDPEIGQMWGYQNDANPSVDINMCAAWELSEGAGVKVALFDSGIDKNQLDLMSNVYPLSFDTCFGEGSSPSEQYWEHATTVAGIIAAEKNNNSMIAGVAPLSKIMDISNKFYATNFNFSEQLANGINWAWLNGAEVINNSWGDQAGGYFDDYHSALLEEALLQAKTMGRNGLGCVIVFSSGNNSLVDYPGNLDSDFIVVGGIDSSGLRSVYNSLSESSAYGIKLDVVAPGSNVHTLAVDDDTTEVYGTSIAAPHVSGLAALILSVNSCLTSKQVADIIEFTAQKVGDYNYTTVNNRTNGTWNDELGYGLIDAYAAVQLAQASYSASLDLVVKDSPVDFGLEPDTYSTFIWNSTDIWIRNQPDGVDEHQNPEYSTTTPTYVYVRVTNRSCQTSLGTENLKVYWAKAGTSLSWPQSWDGTYFFGGALMGNEIGSAVIPTLLPGQEVIVKVPWLPIPNPNDYQNIPFASEPWHFCLLARVDATNDPMTYAETSDLYANVQNNNNIAWKNVTIVNFEDANVGGSTGATVSVGNPFNETKNFNLEFVIEDSETGKPIFIESEVGVKMDPILEAAWIRGGRIAQNTKDTPDDGKKIAIANNVLLRNINFAPRELGMLYLSFNFLTKEITDKSKYTYHVIQRDTETGKIIGGETYLIKKKQRNMFVADAGDDKEFDQGELLTISASQINEAALYNWYDPAGNLVYTGKNLTVTPDITKKFTLEVIAESDGYKDYDEVEFKLKPSSLQAILPNPAVANVTINYKTNQVTSAYLMIIGYYNGDTSIANNYILDTLQTSTSINLSNYQSGFYTVALVCDGQIVDAKTLIKM